MKNLKIFLLTVSAIALLTTMVGFAIIYSVAPQSAWARLLIDLGGLTALISACLLVPKTAELRTEEVADALRDLANGRYDRRLVHRDFAQLSDIAQAFNELAGTLSDNPNLMKSSSPQLPKLKPVAGKHTIDGSHSHHPELGQVQPIPSNQTLKELYEQFKEAHELQGNETVEFSAFESTLLEAQDELMKEHQVRSVRFEVVLEGEEVALRPRLLR